MVGLWPFAITVPSWMTNAIDLFLTRELKWTKFQAVCLLIPSDLSLLSLQCAVHACSRIWTELYFPKNLFFGSLCAKKSALPPQKSIFVANSPFSMISPKGACAPHPLVTGLVIIKVISRDPCMLPFSERNRWRNPGEKGLGYWGN